jgi:hypothetical protein
VLPAKRLSPNRLVVFPAGVTTRRGDRFKEDDRFRLDEPNPSLPANIHVVAVGNNGAVVFSYLDRGVPRLALSDCLPNAPGKVGPIHGYTRPEHLVDLVSGGKALHNRPTLSRDRSYVICPERPAADTGKPTSPPKTMILRFSKRERQRILEALDEDP